MHMESSETKQNRSAAARRAAAPQRIAAVCFAMLLALPVMLRLFCAVPVQAAPGYEAVASGNELANAKKVGRYGMTPVYGRDIEDGSWPVEVISSSSFFRISDAVLEVSDGVMQLTITLASRAYEYVYPGSAKEAAGAPLDAYIPLDESGGRSSFSMPVESLNQAFSCAAFSKNRSKWYDRSLLVDASSLPAEALRIAVPDYDLIEDALDAYEETHPDAVQAARAGAPETQSSDTAEANKAAAVSGSMSGAAEADAEGRQSESTSGAGGNTGQSGSSGAEAGAQTGDELTKIAVMDASVMAQLDEAVPVDRPDGEYAVEVTMTGGSGRASVSSPTWLIVQDGRAFAKLLWSSTYYDYMIVSGRTYLNQTADGGNSVFVIPVTVFDEPMEVIADTTAMGDPVEIDYTLTFYEDSIGSKGQIPQEAAKKVLLTAAVIIAGGGILNHLIKKHREKMA